MDNSSSTASKTSSTKRPLSASLPLYKNIPPALLQKIDHYRSNPDAVAELHQRIAAFNTTIKRGCGTSKTSSSARTRGGSSAAACNTDHVQHNVANVTPWPAIGGLSALRGLVVDVELPGDNHCSTPSGKEATPAGCVSSHQPWEHGGHVGTNSCSSLPTPLPHPQSAAGAGRQQQQQQQQPRGSGTWWQQQPQAATPPAAQPCDSRQAGSPCRRPATATPGVGGPSRQQSAWAGGHTAAGGTAGVRPASACAATRAGSPARPASACARLTTPASPSRTTTAAAAAAAATATAYQLLYAHTQGVAGRVTSPVRSRPGSPARSTRPHSPPGARPCSGTAAQQKQRRCATASCSRPESAAAAAAATLPHNSWCSQGTTSGRMALAAAQGADAGLTRSQVGVSPPRSRPGTAAAAASEAQRHPRQQPGHQRPHSAAAAYHSGRGKAEQHSDGEGWYEDEDSSDEELGVLNNGIRLQLAEQLRTRKTARRQHSAAVTQRRQVAVAAAEQRRETLRHKEAMKAAAREAAARHAAWQELQEERFQAFGGIVRAVTIVKACAQAVRDARVARQRHEQRRAAAQLIAATYKRCLLRRRQRELAQLVVKVHKLLQPYVAHMLIAARRRAARRMVHFLHLTQTSSPVAVAVAHFSRRVLFIQRHWRAMVAIRAAQHQLLYIQLLRMEEKMVHRNKTQAAAAAAASTPRGRAITAAGWGNGDAGASSSPALTSRLRSSTAGAGGVAVAAGGAADTQEACSNSSRPGSAAKQRPNAAAAASTSGSSSTAPSGPKAVFKPGGKNSRPLSGTRTVTQPRASAAPKPTTLGQVAVQLVAQLPEPRWAASGTHGSEGSMAAGDQRPGSAGVMCRLAAADAAAQQFEAQQAQAQQGPPTMGMSAAMVCSLATAAEEATGSSSSSSPPASPSKKRLTVMIPPAEDTSATAGAGSGAVGHHDTPGSYHPAKTPRAPALTVPPTPSAAGGGRGAAGKALGSPRGRRVGVMVDGCDLEVEARLRDLLEMLPHEIRQQVAHQALLAERQHLCVMKDQYASALRRYTAALPIENVRLRLLKDAGLPATSKLQMPKRPRMHLILSQAAVKELIVKGMDLLYERTVGFGAAAAAAAQAEAGIMPQPVGPGGR